MDRCSVCRGPLHAGSPTTLGEENDVLKRLSILPRRVDFAICRYCVNTAIHGAQTALDAKRPVPSDEKEGE